MRLRTMWPLGIRSRAGPSDPGAGAGPLRIR